MTTMQAMLKTSSGTAITSDLPAASMATNTAAQTTKNGSLKRLLGSGSMDRILWGFRPPCLIAGASP
jgi:hypothetical protein